MHSSSYFEVQFVDGSKVDERDVNWSSISEERTVRILGGSKTAFVCKHPVDLVRIVHDGLSTEIDVPDGCEVYQSIKGETVMMSTGERISKSTLGRFVGIVKDGEVIEERYLDGQGNQVIGFKK